MREANLSWYGTSAIALSILALASQGTGRFLMGLAAILMLLAGFVDHVQQRRKAAFALVAAPSAIHQ